MVGLDLTRRYNTEDWQDIWDQPGEKCSLLTNWIQIRTDIELARRRDDVHLI